jgi:hypothetical protein
MRLFSALRNFESIDFETFPPSDLVPGLMQLPMMCPARRYREFVAHLEPQSPRLRKLEVMRV